MINNVVLAGRITRDAELRKTPTGVSTVSFTLACNRRFSNQEGGQQADFINCVAWRQSADFMANYVKQGTLLGVEGRLQVRSYKDQQDRTVYVTEVVCDSVQILASKQSSNTQNQSPNTNTYTPIESAPYEENGSIYGSSAQEYGSVGLNISADDLPF